MLYGGWGLIRDSGRILLEGAPKGLDPDAIGQAMAGCPGSSRSMTSTSGRSRPASRRWPRTCSWRPATTATRAAASCRRCSAGSFEITHATLQVDHERAGTSELLDIGAPER